MDAERWQRVKAIFHDAGERELAARAAFLDQACAGDAELRREVETLLSADDSEDGFLAQPLLARDHGPKAPTAGLEAGQKVGQYRVERRLGAGGMGVVYLATDTELRRPAALKLLPVRLTQDAAKVGRLRQEARAASALNHPNIVTIYEISEAAITSGSEHFIAAEFVDGRTLRDLLQNKSAKEKPEAGMSLGAALDLLIQVAAALAAAHQAGIIHRDIKPENIMLRRDGLVKVLDFGLAKLTEQATRPTASFAQVTTQPGIVMGTVAYMSPEQARGLEVDARSDLFSLGVVMYELLTGHAPFEGQTTGDVLANLLTRDPLPLARHAAELPVALQQIVHRALAKPAEQRYQSAREIGEDLKRLKEELEFAAKLNGTSGSESDILTMRVGAKNSAAGRTTAATHDPVGLTTAVSPRAVSTSSRALAVLIGGLRRHGSAMAAAALALAAIAALVSWRWYAARGNALDSLAVMPFANESGDSQIDYLADGITENMIDGLSRLSPLTVMASSTVFIYKGREFDLRQAGKTLRVGALVTGRVRRQGDQFALQVELFRTADGARLWGDSYQGTLAGLLAAQEQITREIAGALRLRSNGGEQQSLAQRHTRNNGAYELYMTGRHYWNRRNVEGVGKAIKSYQQALEIDPGYALAQVGLADAYTTLNSYQLRPPLETLPLARAAVEQALKLDPQLAEAHASFGKILTDYDWDWTRAESEFKTALALNPNCANAHHWYSTLLAIGGRFDEAVREVKIAQKLDLLSPATNTQVGSVLYRARRYDEAIAALRESLDLDPNFPAAYVYLGVCYLVQKRYTEAVAEFQKAQARWPNASVFVSLLGYAYGLAGQRGQARLCLAKLNEMARLTYVPPNAFVGVHAGLGEMDATFAWLEKSYEEHSPTIRSLKTDPIYDDIRSDPRFISLMRRAGLAP